MTKQYPNATMIRRLAALVYDFFLILGIWVFTLSALIAYLSEPVAAGAPIPNEQVVPTIWLQLICFVEAFLFNFYFWRKKGQTLGMQVWKIRVLNADNALLTPLQACLRFLAACISVVPFGLGFISMKFNSKQLAAHDMLSKTHIVYVGDKPYASEVLPSAE